MSKFLDALAQRVLIYDGAMGTNIQRYQLTAEDYGGQATEGCNEYLVLTKPSVIEEIHTGFLEAGCDVIETDSFTASRLKLDEYGLGQLTHEVNFTAARLARRLADRYSTPEQPRFVAGSIGPTGMLPSSNDPLLSNITYQQLVEIFREQAAALLEGGVDVLLIETSQDILEVRATITGMRRAMQQVGRSVPIQAQVSLDTSGRMLLGTDIAAVMTTLVALRVDIIGLNCSTGPEHMREPVRFLAENCPLPISTIPNAGIPLNVNGLAVYPMEPEPMAAALRDFITEFGVNIIGGCCGSSHEHLQAIVQACRNAPRRPRPIADNNLSDKDFTRIMPPFVSSGIRATALQQDPPPLLVGERVNARAAAKPNRPCSTMTTIRCSPLDANRSRAALTSWIVRRPHRAHRRSRADGKDRQKALDGHRSPSRDRLNRSRRDQSRAGNLPWTRYHQLDQHGNGPPAHRERPADGAGTRLGRCRPHHR